MKARAMSRLHPSRATRARYRRVYAGWRLQRDGARRERRVRRRLRLRNPGSTIVAQPKLVDSDRRTVKVKGRRYVPDFAVIKGFGRFRWARLVEVSTNGERQRWEQPARFSGSHKAQQRLRVDAIFKRPGKLYVLDRGRKGQGSRPVRVFKRGPLRGTVRFMVSR
jgi:hypothetical protein